MKRDYIIFFLSITFSTLSALFLLHGDVVANVNDNNSNIKLLKQEQTFNAKQHEETKTLLEKLIISDYELALKVERLATLIEED